MTFSSRLLSEEDNLLEESNKETETITSKLDFIIEFADNDMFNVWIMRTFQRYINIRMKNYDFWEIIHFDFEEWQKHHWSKLTIITWDFIKNCCYSREFWIDRLDTKDTRVSNMLRAATKKYNENWSMKQIKWVKNHYDIISKYSYKRKQRLLSNSIFSSDQSLSIQLSHSETSTISQTNQLNTLHMLQSSNQSNISHMHTHSQQSQSTN